jgi:hypothetical protein
MSRMISAWECVCNPFLTMHVSSEGPSISAPWEPRHLQPLLSILHFLCFLAALWWQRAAARMPGIVIVIIVLLSGIPPVLPPPGAFFRGGRQGGDTKIEGICSI